MATRFIESQENSSTQLSRIIQGQSQLITDHIDRRHYEQKQAAADEKEKAVRQQFIDSLLFPEISNREDRIEAAHEETFQWIFDDPETEAKPWDSFVDWLKSDSDTYWINGKAGSGKSTLMKFICQNKRTQDLLNIWAGSNKLLTPAFFFWASGTSLQQSIEGLLRSVILQIVNSNQHLVQPLIHLKSRSILLTGTMNMWTQNQLLSCLDFIINELSSDCYVCLFLDGLDEFTGDYDELTKLIKQLAQKKHFKCCFSSRPEAEFEYDYSKSKRLKLQDLTRPDIERFVQARLAGFEQIRSLPQDKEAKMSILEQIIISKADGVFLWVKLAVDSQILGIKRNDPWELLRERLNALPNAVEKIYEGMLAKLEPLYRRDAAWYLEAALRFQENSSRIVPLVGNFAMAKFGLTSDFGLTDELHATNFESKCREAKQGIETSCAGLLEIVESNNDDLYTDFGFPYSSTEWAAKYVQFYHRTVKTYVESNYGGRKYLAKYTTFRHSPYLAAALQLVILKLCETKGLTSLLRNHTCILLQCMFSDKPKGKETVGWLTQVQQLDDELQNLYKQSSYFTTGSHWCQTWLLNSSWEDSHLPLTSTYLANDFLSLAAVCGGYWYVNEILKTTTLYPRRATRLAYCVMMREAFVHADNCCEYRGGLGHPEQVRLWEQVDLLTKLLKHGANPNVGEPQTIWSATLSFLYRFEPTVRSLPPESLTQTKRCKEEKEGIQIIKAFLDAGANPKQSFLVSKYYYSLIIKLKVQSSLPSSSQKLGSRKLNPPRAAKISYSRTTSSTRIRHRIRFESPFRNGAKWLQCCNLWSKAGLKISNAQLTAFEALTRHFREQHGLYKYLIPKLLFMDDCETCQWVLKEQRMILAEVESMRL